MPHGSSFLRGNLIMASIDHAIWFHRPARVDEWLLYSLDSPVELGRARVRARQFLYARRRARGEHRAGRPHTPRAAAILILGAGLLAVAGAAPPSPRRCPPMTVTRLSAAVDRHLRRLRRAGRERRRVLAAHAAGRPAARADQYPPRPVALAGLARPVRRGVSVRRAVRAATAVLLSIERRARPRTARCACGSSRARRTPANPASLDGRRRGIRRGLRPVPQARRRQFRGGTRGRGCSSPKRSEQRWLDYRVVIGDGLFWYRKRTLTLPQDELVEEIAGFPHVDLEEARLFSCGISWTTRNRRGPRRSLGQRRPARPRWPRAFPHARRPRAHARCCTAATGRCPKVANRWCSSSSDGQRGQRTDRVELDVARRRARGYRYRLARDRLRAGVSETGEQRS